jgi:hypothetical protein
MATVSSSELPAHLERNLATFRKEFKEWKRMNNLMNPIDKRLKDYMISNNIDRLEGDGIVITMAHPTRFILDQTLIPNIDFFKRERLTNVATVTID